jgi:DNA end-binding protein Ku
LLHEDDHRRIQMKIHCPEHGEIPRSETVRGFEWSKGQYVVLEESDFEAVPLKTVRAIEIEQFVPARRDGDQTAFVKQSYYLEPEAVGRKAFGLLKAILSESDLQAICKIVIKDREQLAALDPFGPTMLLSTLYWPDEVRDVGELDLADEEPDFKKTELDMARQLVEALTGEFDAARYHDEYREALLKVIEAKVDGQPIAAPEPVAETSKLTDLMAVLEASVAAARADAGRAGDGRSGKGKASTGKRAKADESAEPVSVDSARKAGSSGSKPAAGKRSASRAASGSRRSSSSEATTTRRRKSA